MGNKKVLVTGGTGFVGAYLLRGLVKKGYVVKAIKRSTSPMAMVKELGSQVEWLEGDILDVPFLEKAMKGVEQVYHSAAVISFDPKKVAQMFKINVEGTANMVNTALHEGVEKFIHISSIAALGRKEFQPDIREDAQWENSKENSNYAISKFKAECEVWRGMQEGLNMAIINPSVILGAGYWNQGSCKLFEKVSKGLSYYPQGSTGFVDVRDVARAAITLMESNVSGERFIVNGENWTFEEYFKTTAKALNKKEPTKKAAKWLVNVLWRLEWIRSKLLRTEPLLTRETARTSQSTYYYHSDKIKKELNFSFTEIDKCIKETGAIYLESQKQNKNFGFLPPIDG